MYVCVFTLFTLTFPHLIKMNIENVFSRFLKFLNPPKKVLLYASWLIFFFGEEANEDWNNLGRINLRIPQGHKIKKKNKQITLCNTIFGLKLGNKNLCMM